MHMQNYDIPFCNSNILFSIMTFLFAICLKSPCKKHQSATGKALAYSISREKYLKVFLDDGYVPIDNSATERAIRPFTIGRKNFVLIDTISGAKASAIAYSIVETAKANNLNVYEYLSYVLSEMPKHMNSSDLSFIDNLLPWSDALPASCRSKR